MELGLMGLGEIDPQTMPSINVVYDQNGYAQDAATGYYIGVCYDANSAPYECTSGARILNIDRRLLDSQKPKTDYMPYLLIGGGALLLLALTAKR